jgi:YebC/PmpR family DNA-binding regulatory protein
LFAKLAKAITVAAKGGGVEPAMNAKLRLAIERARGFNMPSHNIERAVERGGSGKGAGELFEVLYEAYAPGGAALLIEGVTDNKNRTAAEIKHLLSEYGGKLAGSGAVAWMFERRGLILLSEDENPKLRDPESELSLIDLGALDIIREKEGVTLSVPTQKRQEIAETLTKQGWVVSESYDVMAPQTPVTLPEEHLDLRLIEALEEHDDVQNVWSNLRGW